MAERRSSDIYTPFGYVEISATRLDGNTAGNGWAVHLSFGRPSSGLFERFLTTEEARAMADALIASADFYDAETARLAGESLPDTLPADIAQPEALAGVAA